MARRRRPGDEAEADFQKSVVQLAKLQGWSIYHTYDSRRSHSGWPDLVLARGDTVLFRELKSAFGVVKPDQEAWLASLTAGGLDAKVWRPGDWPEIEKELKR
jgi:hypothetical protein